MCIEGSYSLWSHDGQQFEFLRVCAFPHMLLDQKISPLGFRVLGVQFSGSSESGAEDETIFSYAGVVNEHAARVPTYISLQTNFYAEIAVVVRQP